MVSMHRLVGEIITVYYYSIHEEMDGSVGDLSCVSTWKGVCGPRESFPSLSLSLLYFLSLFFCSDVD